MEESSCSNLATTHLRGSVPADVNEEKKASYEVPGANMQIFPPNNGGGGRGRGGYQTLGAPTGPMIPLSWSVYLVAVFQGLYHQQRSRLWCRPKLELFFVWHLRTLARKSTGNLPFYLSFSTTIFFLFDHRVALLSGELILLPQDITVRGILLEQYFLWI